jgi:hypothetical protein
MPDLTHVGSNACTLRLHVNFLKSSVRAIGVGRILTNLAMIPSYHPIVNQELLMMFVMNTHSKSSHILSATNYVVKTRRSTLTKRRCQQKPSRERMRHFHNNSEKVPPLLISSPGSQFVPPRGNQTPSKPTPDPTNPARRRLSRVSSQSPYRPLPRWPAA